MKFVGDFTIEKKSEQSGKPSRLSGLRNSIIPESESQKHNLGQISRKKTAESYGVVFDCINSGVIIIEVKNEGQSFCLSYVNKYIEKLCSIKRTNEIGKNILDVFPILKGLGIIEFLKRIRSTGKSEKIPWIKKNNGRYSVWIDNSICKLSDDEIIVTSTDRTTEENLKLQVKDNSTLLTKILNTSTDGIFITNEKNNEMSYNSAFKEMFHLSSDPKDFKLSFGNSKKIYRAFSEPYVVASKVKFLCKNKEQTFYGIFSLKNDQVVEYCMIPLKSEDGAFEGRVWRVHLISNVKNNSVLSEDTKKIPFVNLCNKDFLITERSISRSTDINRTFVNTYGISQRTLMYCTESLQKKIPFEHSNLQTDEKEKWFRTQITPYTTDNLLVNSSLMYVNDMADLKNAEIASEKHRQQLIQADKMVSLGILISGIAHEINNPNNFVMLNSEIFSDAWLDAIPILEHYYKENGDFSIGGLPFSKARGRFTELLNGMREGTERIRRIVQSLKDYARKEEDDVQQMTNVHEIIDAAIVITANMIKKSTDKFTLNKCENIPVLIGNPQKLEQVLINLICNSCQALPDRSKALEIITSYDKITDCIIIIVKDEGIGISEENLPHVMDPFFTTKRDFGGTGLGLSISYTIIQAHHGTIDIKSQLNRGTKVTITLPLRVQSSK